LQKVINIKNNSKVLIDALITKNIDYESALIISKFP
jgi:hypothetical protein